VGVDLFFALSGFLITGILLDSLNKNGYFRNFYARRALRIFPLYYGFLFTLICLTHPLHLQWQGKQYLLLTYTQNLGIFTKDYMGFTPARFINLNHFWSLAVEEQFYFVWPLVIFLVRDYRRLLFVTIGISMGALLLRIVFVSHGALPATIYEFTPCRIDALLLGGTLAILYRTRYQQVILRYSVPVFFVFLTALACLAYPLHGLDWKAPIIETAGFTLTALTSVALIAVALAGTPWAKSAFENRVMRFLGKYSYGIYVFHYSFDAAFTAPLRRWLVSTFHSKGIAVALASIPVIVCTLLIAYASYHLYEKRFLNLKRYFEPKPKAAPLTAVRG
jgi:peptidoglycan/LPS O-acetylase OafA/YrhL